MKRILVLSKTRSPLPLQWDVNLVTSGLTVQDDFKQWSLWLQALSPNNWPWQELYVQSQGVEWIAYVRVNYKVEDPVTKKTALIRAWCWHGSRSFNVISKGTVTAALPSGLKIRGRLCQVVYTTHDVIQFNGTLESKTDLLLLSSNEMLPLYHSKLSSLLC